MTGRRGGVVIAVVIGVLAVLAPIWLSVGLARRQSLENEEARTMGYAHDVMHRVDETRVQSGAAVDELRKAQLAPCSEPEMDIMRRLDLSSSYIQAIGRIEGNRLICTSLGTKEPIEIGPPDVLTENGVAERINVRLPVARTYPLTVVAQNGYAILLDPSLPVDTQTEEGGVEIAVYTPSSKNHVILASRGKSFRPEWFNPIAKGSEQTLLEGDSVVSIIRSANSDTAVVVAVPRVYVGRGVRRFALIFVPIGLLCGAGLAWAVLYLSRVHLSLPAVLKGAARRKEFIVEYQPIVELATGRWVGAEALVRWQRRGKIIRPDQFILTAEISGVITLITECVTEVVAGDLPKLRKIDPGFQVAINLSAVDIMSGRTVAMLQRLMETSGAGPENIEIEATERGFLQGPEAREVIAAVRAMGVSVAIDDFGTGYSSLSCLQTLGLDTLKIDKSFVETIGTDGATSQVVPHIIEMAHSMKLEMVAEGVETEAQAEFLRERGVRYAQGWLFGRPMTAAALCEGMEAHSAARGIVVQV